MAFKKKKAPPADAPGPDDDGEYEASNWNFQVYSLAYALFYSLQVDSIVGHKKEKGKTLYRVHWKGYPNSDDSWLPSADITCKDMLKRYKKRIEKETKDVYVVSCQIITQFTSLTLDV